MNQKKASIQFKDFKIKRSLFEYKTLGKIENEYRVAINPKAILKPKEGLYAIELDLKINSSDELLNIEILTVGLFDIEGYEEDSANMNSFLYINAPSILFPYIRAYISTITTQSGIETIMLPTYNLSSLAEDLKKNTYIANENL